MSAFLNRSLKCNTWQIDSKCKSCVTYFKTICSFGQTFCNLTRYKKLCVMIASNPVAKKLKINIGGGGGLL
jgi:hypothetical protein